MANVLIQPVSGAIQFNEKTAGGTCVPDLSSSGIKLSQVDSSGLQVESHFGGLTGGTRFSVQGEGGQLLSVTDALTGDVFSVNDASGLPIINVNSCFIDVVKIGTHGTNALVVSGGDVSIGTSTPSTSIESSGKNKLTVAGTISAGGDILIDSISATKSDPNYFAGKVGIGTNGPQVALHLADSCALAFGDGSDLILCHNSSHSYIKDNGTGGLYIQTNGPAIYFQDTDGNPLAQFTDGGSNFLMYNGAIKLTTKTNGVSIDGSITNSGNISAIGSLSASSACIGGDLKWTGNATNGGNNDLVMGTGNLKFADTGRVRIGDSNDLELYHDATNSRIENGDGELLIIQNANGEDMCFYGDDGSGNIATYFHLDGGGVCTIFSKDTRHTDSVKAKFGTNSDLCLYHDGSDSYITQNNSGTGSLKIVQEIDNEDIRIFNDNGYGGTAEYMRFDGSTEKILLGPGLPASAGEVGIGTSSPAAKLHIQGCDSTGGLRIDNGSGGSDHVNFYHVDGGNDSDFFITYSGTGGAEITLKADGSTILNASNGDNVGIGETAPGEKLTVAGNISAQGGLSGQSACIGGNVNLPDNAYAMFGTGNDLKIRHNGTDSSIANTCGDLYIQNEKDD